MNPYRTEQVSLTTEKTLIKSETSYKAGAVVEVGGKATCSRTGVDGLKQIK